MFRQLFTVIAVSAYLTIVLSIKCYTGTDEKCYLASDKEDCGESTGCACAKYFFQCSSNDRACTTDEQQNKVRKWAYIVISQSMCQQMQMFSQIYSQLECCTTDECNRPDQGKCSWALARRRAFRKLADLLDF